MHISSSSPSYLIFRIFLPLLLLFSTIIPTVHSQDQGQDQQQSDEQPPEQQEPPPPPPFFYKGHDLSSLFIMEAGPPGAIFKDTARDNETRLADDILIDGGMNTVRLRLWVDPIVPFDGPPGYYQTYNLPTILSLAQRFTSKSLQIYLDLHFSSYWADPAKQTPPASWPSDLSPLADTVQSYVSSVIREFYTAGVPLALVSLGNEIRNGMLWPLGKVDVGVEDEAERTEGFKGLATLLKAARRGVDDGVAASNPPNTNTTDDNGNVIIIPPPQVMIHIDNGWDLTMLTRWFTALVSTNIFSVSDWDVFGLTFYPFYGTGATFETLTNTVNSLAETYGKAIHVVETDWPVACGGEGAPSLSEPEIPISVEGQLEWVGRIVDVVKQIPNGLGQGVHYWEPAWVNSTALGSKCQDVILFDTDWSEYPAVTAYSRRSVDMFKDV